MVRQPTNVLDFLALTLNKKKVIQKNNQRNYKLFTKEKMSKHG